MNPTEVSVLFMDDEVHDTTAVVVNEAIVSLQKRGYQVTVVDRMSEAIDEFYRRFYKVFILDIDMAQVADAFSQKGERGTKVASIYRALDNGTAVIMFSAQGRVPDWFEVGNRHIFGYVHKEQAGAIRKLLELVERAAISDTRGLELPVPRRTGPVLVCNAGTTRHDEDSLRRVVKAAGDFSPVFCALQDMAPRLQQEDCAAALLLADRFTTRPDVLRHIDAVGACQPRPQVVIACEGSQEAMDSILHIINARPFRLVNLLAADAAEALSRSVRDAAHWYAGNECFPAESEYVHRAAEGINWQQLDEQFGATGEMPEDADDKEDEA